MNGLGLLVKESSGLWEAKKIKEKQYCVSFIFITNLFLDI